MTFKCPKADYGEKPNQISQETWKKYVYSCEVGYCESFCFGEGCRELKDCPVYNLHKKQRSK